MIWTTIQLNFMRLRHNRAEWLLTFAVPILFFTIFAWIFGSRGNGTTPQIKIALYDGVGSEFSRQLVQSLEQSASFRIHERPLLNADNKSMHKKFRTHLEGLVRRGVVAAAIAVDPVDQPAANEQPFQVTILSDSFDQVASQTIGALVQKALLSASVATKASKAPRPIASPETQVVAASSWSTAMGEPSSIPIAIEPPRIEVVDVMAQKKTNPVIAMYAAGIAVMFVLFSATTASGTLLDEHENSTLERLLCSRLTIDQLLMGKWCYLTLVSLLQITIMFVYGAWFFHLNLAEHWDGFLVMTLVTSAAAASFALMLATLCRTRTQLGWVSTVLILTMSALGGSMVPRYLMSERIQQAGKLTFNAWALDGYNKVFWRELPLTALKQELMVLVACAFLFMVAARCFATRWDRA